MSRKCVWHVLPIAGLLCLPWLAGCHSPTDVTRNIAKVNSVTYERDRAPEPTTTREPWVILWHLRIGDALNRSDEIACPLELIDADTFACRRKTPLDWNVPVDVDNTIYVDDPAVGQASATSRIWVNGTLITRVEGKVAKFRISSDQIIR